MDEIAAQDAGNVNCCAYALFQEPWWLDAVAPGAWEEVAVTHNGTIEARLPFVLKRRLGLTAITQPPLTQFLGPWIRPGARKYPLELARQKDVIESLVKQLPKCDMIRMRLAPQLTNWLPFYWQGFSAMPVYTYKIEALDDCNRIWSEFTAETRTHIRKAEKTVAIRNDTGIDAVRNLHEATFKRQKKQSRVSKDLIYRVYEACTRRNQGRVFVAEDGRGRQHAGTYLVWDDRSAYLLFGGMDHELSKTGAMSLVVWEAIKWASQVTHAFDFEGSMIESIERFFRQFGARQVLSFKLLRMGTRMRALYAARDLTVSAFGRQRELLDGLR